MKCAALPAILLLSLAFAGSAATAETPVIQLDESDFHATADVHRFILAIAEPTATARTGDGQSDRAVTLGRNSKGELVVTSMQVMAAGQSPDFPDGTVAVMIVRRPGVCQPPHGEDYRGLFKRIFTFVIDHRGQNIWELGYVHGVGSIRLVKGPDAFGPEETFNVDPSRYKTYACANYD